MIPKKNPNIDLEKRKALFFEIGLVAALLIILISFQWSVEVKQVEELVNLQDLGYEEEIIPITRQEPPEKQVELPPKLKILDVITIVDDEEDIDQELELVDVEADQETKVDIPRDVAVEEEDIDEIEIFVVVEEMPIFRPKICKNQKEGDLELFRYINSKIRYPVIAQENGIEGRVFVKFIVNQDGSVGNAEIMRGVDPSLDKEALRVINSLPRFEPGKQRGRPVKVSYTASINFVILQ